MMKELSKQEVVAKHREMWNWIANETLKRKRKISKAEYFSEMKIPFGHRPLFGCYCCEYTKQKAKNLDIYCNLCPLDWGSKVNGFMCENKYEHYDKKGLYAQWRCEIDYKKYAELAREIANLEERE